MMSRAAVALCIILSVVVFQGDVDAQASFERAALALALIQAFWCWYALRRAGHEPLRVLLHGTGWGYAQEELPESEAGLAVLLWLLPAFCWMWQDIAVV